MTMSGEGRVRGRRQYDCVGARKSCGDARYDVSPH